MALSSHGVPLTLLQEQQAALGLHLALCMIGNTGARWADPQSELSAGLQPALLAASTPSVEGAA